MVMQGVLSLIIGVLAANERSGVGFVDELGHEKPGWPAYFPFDAHSHSVGTDRTDLTSGPPVIKVTPVISFSTTGKLDNDT